MKKISKDEYNSFSATGLNPQLQEILAIEVDEVIAMGFDEWKLNYVPASALYQLAHRKGKKFSMKTDKEGKQWMFLRVR